MFGVLRSVLLFAIFLMQALTWHCPLQDCEYCIEPQVRFAPGIGFELTASYGVSAARHHNGSVQNLAVVPAQSEYTDLFLRLAQLASRPKPWPWSRHLRRLNKKLGRPATKDVGVLSTLIDSLAKTTANVLNQTLNRIVVTAPDLPALTMDDINDAIEHAGLRSWLIYPMPSPEQLYTANAAFAGMGHGLCGAWWDIGACQDEIMDGDIPTEHVLAVSFTNTTLITSVSWINYAFYYQRNDTHIVAPHLGLASLASYQSPTDYWSAVREHLQMLPKRFAQQGAPITALVVSGESVSVPEFREALNVALGTIWINASNKSEEEPIDPLWVAARGAARYASIRQQVPDGCQELPHCYDHEWDRDEESSSSQMIKSEL